MNTKIINKIDGQNNAFWYYGDGDLAVITHKQRKIIIFVSGDIRVKFPNENLILKNAQAVDYAIQNHFSDSDLLSATFYYSCNFDFEFINTESNESFNFIEDADFYYDEAIKYAQKAILDDNVWN
jgi:hypothetical protein